MSVAPAANLEAKQYPVGRFGAPAASGAAERQRWIEEIAALPAELRRATAGLTAEQWETPYREGGWRVRQVVHHLADSHMNAFIRFKLALTENEPTITAYNQTVWGETADTQAPGAGSLALLEALHERWTRLLRALGPAEFGRKFRHPERGVMTLELNLALYAWHGRHHTGHILGLRRERGW